VSVYVTEACGVTFNIPSCSGGRRFECRPGNYFSSVFPENFPDIMLSLSMLRSRYLVQDHHHHHHLRSNSANLYMYFFVSNLNYLFRVISGCALVTTGKCA
jgi:hypothetical protein